jgi:FKBP-type peptidyl-prolyl cis-trans isomerase FkpA
VTVAGFCHRTVTTALCLCLAAGAAACGSSPVGPTPSAPYSQTDVVAGEGAAAALGNSVTVNYTGWLYDPSKTNLKGLEFDSSAGKEAFTFFLGLGQVISGFDQGVVGMQVGGVRRLVIPPSLGYGTARNGPIPPSATLVFEIQLVSVQ